MKRIDLASWNRNEHFQFFSAFDEPFFSLVSEINSSKAFEKSKTDKPSFFARYLHASIRTVNEIPEFKFRIHEDRVVQFDTINASPTLGRPDGTFGFGFIPYTEDLQDFARALALDSERVRNSSGLGVSPNTSRQDVEKWTPSLGQFFLILRCERSGVHYPTSFLIDSLKYTSSGVSLSSD